MRVYRWVLALGLGLCGCGVEVIEADTSRSSIERRWADDAGTGYADGGWPTTSPVMPDAGYPVAPVPNPGPVAPSYPEPAPVAPDAGVAPPSYPVYPIYPDPPPDAGTGPRPAPIQLSCSDVVWTFAHPYASYADFAVYYSLTTETDGATRATCVVEHRAAPRNDAVASVRQATVSASATQATPECSPEPGWVFTRYSNGIGVSYSTADASGSRIMNCSGSH